MMKFYKFIATSIFALSACAATTVDTEVPELEYTVDDELTIRSPSDITFKFQNSSKKAICILADDFRDHPSRPLLRVVDMDSGQIAQYNGVLADKPLFNTEPAYIIVRPQSISELTFTVSDNYSINPERDYIVRYSLPVIDCEALLQTEIDMPNGSAPFSQLREWNEPDWQLILNRLRSFYNEWSEVGRFIELEEIISVPNSK